MSYDGSFDDLTAFEKVLAEAIWRTSREDEGSISATGANVIAKTLVRRGVVHPPARADRFEAEADAMRGSLAGLVLLTTSDGGGVRSTILSRSVWAAASRHGIPTPEPAPEPRPRPRGIRFPKEPS